MADTMSFVTQECLFFWHNYDWKADRSLGHTCKPSKYFVNGIWIPFYSESTSAVMEWNLYPQPRVSPFLLLHPLSSSSPSGTVLWSGWLVLSPQLCPVGLPWSPKEALCLSLTAHLFPFLHSPPHLTLSSLFARMCLVCPPLDPKLPQHRRQACQVRSKCSLNYLLREWTARCFLLNHLPIFMPLGSQTQIKDPQD